MFVVIICIISNGELGVHYRLPEKVPGGVIPKELATPGGKSDEGELPLQTASREAEEELGIKLIAPRVIGTIKKIPSKKTPGICYDCHVVICEKWKGEIQNPEPHKHSMLTFKTKEECLADPSGTDLLRMTVDLLSKTGRLV